MTIKSPLANHKRRKKGFTLTEIAIVLGIIGLILGAIWGAASSVYANVKTADAQRGIIATASAVRAMYANSPTFSTTGSITAPGMFPVEWNSTTAGKTGNPWQKNPTNNASYVMSKEGTGQFDVQLDGIDPAGCVSLINTFTKNASSTNGGSVMGLVGTQVDAAAPTLGTPKITGTSTEGTFAAATSCTGAAGDNNISIGFDITKM